MLGYHRAASILDIWPSFRWASLCFAVPWATQEAARLSSAFTETSNPTEFAELHSWFIAVNWLLIFLVDLP
jgi:hypothetical protein